MDLKRVLSWMTKIFYLVVNFLLMLVSFFFRLPTGRFSTEKINAVLVHGFLARKEILFLLKKKLEKLGFNVILPELGWGTRDITSYAEDLIAFLKREMMGKTILLGSSLGGIIILEARRLDPEIAKIPAITLGVSRSRNAGCLYYPVVPIRTSDAAGKRVPWTPERIFER